MVIGIGGVSRAGKTRLARKLAGHFRGQGRTAVILHQDEFVFPEAEIPTIRGKADWEHPGSIDFERFRQAIAAQAETVDVVIAEGLLAFYDAAVNALYDRCFFMKISKATFLERKARDLRWGREPDWYMEHIWESFLKYGQPGPGRPAVFTLSGEAAYDWEEVLAFLAG